MYLDTSFCSQEVAPLFMRIKTELTDYQIFPAVSKTKSVDSTSVSTLFYSLNFKAKSFLTLYILACSTISN